MLKHYKSIVDEIFVVVYRQSEDDGILEDYLIRMILIKKIGITSNISVSAQTATGLQDVEASVFGIDQDKAKGKSTTQENTLNALTGSSIPLKAVSLSQT